MESAPLGIMHATNRNAASPAVKSPGTDVRRDCSKSKSIIIHLAAPIGLKHSVSSLLRQFHRLVIDGSASRLRHHTSGVGDSVIPPLASFGSKKTDNLRHPPPRAVLAARSDRFLTPGPHVDKRCQDEARSRISSPAGMCNRLQPAVPIRIGETSTTSNTGAGNRRTAAI